MGVYEDRNDIDSPCSKGLKNKKLCGLIQRVRIINKVFFLHYLFYRKFKREFATLFKRPIKPSKLFFISSLMLDDFEI